MQVGEDDEIMLITDAGTLVRTAVAGVTTVGRNTQGVRLIRLNDGESLVELTPIDEADVNVDELENVEAAATTSGDADHDGDGISGVSDDDAGNSAETGESASDDDSSDGSADDIDPEN